MAPIKTRSTPSHTKNLRKKTDTVGVYLRLRPLKTDEPTLVKIDSQRVETKRPDGSSHQIYKFNHIFDCESQREVFIKVAKPIVDDLVNIGKDGLIFTYGITGSGKTYTMEGHANNPGLIYRTIDCVFNSIGPQQTPKGLIASDGVNGYRVRKSTSLYPHLSEALPTMPSVIKWQNRSKETSSVTADPLAYYCLFISLTELYNKQVIDLFEDFQDPKEKKRREIRADARGINFVANAMEIEVKSAEEAVEYYARGVKRRRTGSTALNQESSRGHCVFTMKLVRIMKAPSGHFNEDTLISSQLCLVDLAGSERAKRSGATGGALHEACNINNSLGALRKCIRALRDCEPTNLQYRDYTLTRLFQSYFEGVGAVRMVLCVKPTPQDFDENNMAMDFGVLSQDVAIDYASPAKMAKRSSKTRKIVPNSDVSDEQFIEDWIGTLKNNRDARKRYIETSIAAQAEVRQNILMTFNEITSLSQELKSKEARINEIEEEKEEAWKQIEYAKSEKRRLLKRIMKTQVVEAPPSAPLQSSSPINHPHPSESYTTETGTPPTTTNSSALESHEHLVLSQPCKGGVPVVNPRHNRSLSCSSMQWIHHKPPGTIDMGTVLKPKLKNGRSVKNLRSSDILRKDAAGYSVVHQDADSNGDVETSVFKGHIVSTVCGGAQVILDDIETMKQVSPKRKRVDTQ